MTTPERRPHKVHQTSTAPRRPHSGTPSGFNPEKAAQALADGLKYLLKQWSWSGSKVSRLLHLSPTTINGWLRKGAIPVAAQGLSPEVEAVTHLLAIHRNLTAMFNEPFHQIEWLKTPHPDLGVSPQSKMEESMAGLILIRQYLDFVTGRGA